MLEEATLKDAIRNAPTGSSAAGRVRSRAKAGRAVRYGDYMRFMKVSAAEHHKWVLALRPPQWPRPGLEGTLGDVCCARWKPIS